MLWVMVKHGLFWLPWLTVSPRAKCTHWRTHTFKAVEPCPHLPALSVILTQGIPKQCANPYCPHSLFITQQLSYEKYPPNQCHTSKSTSASSFPSPVYPYNSQAPSQPHLKQPQPRDVPGKLTLQNQLHDFQSHPACGELSNTTVLGMPAKAEWSNSITGSLNPPDIVFKQPFSWLVF